MIQMRVILPALALIVSSVALVVVINNKNNSNIQTFHDIKLHEHKYGCPIGFSLVLEPLGCKAIIK